MRKLIPLTLFAAMAVHASCALADMETPEALLQKRWPISSINIIGVPAAEKARLLESVVLPSGETVGMAELDRFVDSCSDTAEKREVLHCDVRMTADTLEIAIDYVSAERRAQWAKDAAQRKDVSLPPMLVSHVNDYRRAEMDAVNQGQASLPKSREGDHRDRVLRALVAVHRAEIFDVLKTSRSDEQRALAAMALGWDPSPELALPVALAQIEDENRWVRAALSAFLHLEFGQRLKTLDESQQLAIARAWVSQITEPSPFDRLKGIWGLDNSVRANPSMKALIGPPERAVFEALLAQGTLLEAPIRTLMQ